ETLAQRDLHRLIGVDTEARAPDAERSVGLGSAGVLAEHPLPAPSPDVEREVDRAVLGGQCARSRGVPGREEASQEEDDDRAHLTAADVGVVPAVGAGSLRLRPERAHARASRSAEICIAAKRPESITIGTPPPGWVPPPA